MGWLAEPNRQTSNGSSAVRSWLGIVFVCQITEAEAGCSDCECRRKCEETNGLCTAFTYYPKWGTCWLKNGTASITWRNDRVTGIVGTYI
jgi:hypothetical protein